VALRIFFLIFGLLSVANGIYMLYRPDHWFYNIPAAVPDTGEYNAHFVRDIGLAYLISGFGFLWSAIYIAKCRIVHLGNTLFVAGHAVLHVMEIAVGRLPKDHLIHDAPGVLVPGLIMVILCVPAVWDRVNPLDLG
jgi:hypothetical protein